MSEFKVDNDTVRQFFIEVMSKLPIARIDSQPLYQSYQNWCNDNGYKNPLAKQTFIKQIKGILNEQQNKIDSISMQVFDDIAKNKDNRNEMITKYLPLLRCSYGYSYIYPTSKYSSYVDDNGINYVSNRQKRSFKFPLRELLFEVLDLYDNLPDEDNLEYEKNNRKIIDYQKRLIK